MLNLLALGIRWKVFGELDLLSFFELPLRFGERDGAKLRAIQEAAIAKEQDASLSPLELSAFRKCACFEALGIVLANSKLKPDAGKRIKHCESLRPALDMIAAKLRDDISIASLAKACGLSRPQFHHVFKEMTGVAPLEHQRSLRLAEAKRLLLESSMNVAETGASLGWRDPFHFSRIFKKFCGHSPREFRRRCAEGLELPH